MRDAHEGWSGLDTLLFGYSGAAMGGVIPEIEGLINAWGTATKVAFVVAACMALASLGIGVLTAGYRGIPMSRRGRLSAFCARFSTVLFTAIFIIATSCQFGRIACIAGVSSAAVVASLMTTLWAFEGRSSSAEAVSSFWGRLWRRQRMPAAAESVHQLDPIV